MPRMTAVEAAVHVLEKEGVEVCFGVPGAAINPFYAAMRAHGGIRHILARHVEGASHMADGYSRAKAGNIGVCIGTSGPAGTDMITGLYAAAADRVPILCITGQAPRARLHKEDFQAIDIQLIAKPVTNGPYRPRAGAGSARVPASLPPHAFGPARPRADRPAVRRSDRRDRVRRRYLRAAAGLQATASRRQIEKALAMLDASERPLIVAGGGIINADASPNCWSSSLKSSAFRSSRP